VLREAVYCIYFRPGPIARPRDNATLSQESAEDETDK
jgi:hypothetical protein